jgi:hypothetical protein
MQGMTRSQFNMIAAYALLPIAVIAPLIGLWRESHKESGRLLAIVWLAALILACATLLILKIRLLRQQKNPKAPSATHC